MTSGSSETPAQIYPAYTFSASPTYNAWVKLTAADVHALRSESGFEGQNLYFHLNHPIRYVRLVGTVVAHDQIYERLHILTLDDGSGATIDVRVQHEPMPSPLDVAELLSPDGEDDSCRNGVSLDDAPATAARQPPVAVVHPTSVPNLTLNTTPTDPLPTLHHVRTPLQPGTVVKAKGTLSRFRQVLQLDLKRLTLVTSTAEEAQCWTELAEFYNAVLAQPWVLSASEVERLERVDEAAVLQEQRRERATRRKKRRREERGQGRDGKRSRLEESLEKKRLREEREPDLARTGA